MNRSNRTATVSIPGGVSTLSAVLDAVFAADPAAAVRYARTYGTEWAAADVSAELEALDAVTASLASAVSL